MSKQTSQPPTTMYTKIANQSSTLSIQLLRQVLKCSMALTMKTRFHTYNAGITKVHLSEQHGKLHITELSGKEICVHEVSALKGKKIILRTHGRNMEPKVTELIYQTASLFENIEKAQQWLIAIKLHKKRYIRDQIQMIERVIENNNAFDISRALDYVHANNILSATDFKAYLDYPLRKNP